jgi:hypothetical protein
MLNLFLVTFSLRNPNKDYSQFLVTLRGNAQQWWHFIEQSCVVTTFHDVDTYSKLLLPHIEKTDSLLVVEITPNQFQGWLPKEAWDWLKQVSDQKNAQLALPWAALLPPPK